MLVHLHIRHFAIIDSSELELASGMTALTGETGAGKSILLDALGLIIGARASSDSIQHGKDRADITATFNIDTMSGVAHWLAEHELDAEGECIVRRTVSVSGKSRATVNDVPVSVQLLRELGEKLVSIHGQHAHQRLAKASEQRALLDAYAGGNQLAGVAAAFKDWQAADQACEAHARNSLAREQRLDLLSFQLREFDELDIGSESVTDIESEHRWLASAERIRSLGQEVVELLDAQAMPALAQCSKPLTELVSIDERLRESLDLIDSAAIQAEEAMALVRSHVSSLEHDDARLNWLDEKLKAIHRLTRKHQCDASELATIENTLREEYEQLTAPEQSEEELQFERDRLREAFDKASARLSRHRKKYAKQLSEAITQTMQELNMSGGTFEIRVTAGKSDPSPTGTDTIEFLVCTNPGSSPAPLSRVASGGELSRISLGLQLATLGTQATPTLVFDEVDSGVGGSVAETVGKLLRQVGTQSQVLCVTHLPQVAVQANNHLLVTKDVADGKTRTFISTLDSAGTQREIARMLGGSSITEKTLQHAQEMLESVS